MLKKSTLIGLLIAFAMTILTTTQVSAQRGHYKGGRGSSHKGGKYKNPSTGNHYRKRR